MEGTQLAEAYVKLSAVGHREVDDAIGGINRGLMDMSIAGVSLGTLFTTGALAAGLKQAISDFSEAESIAARLEAVLNATGWAAGMSGTQIQELSGSLQDLSRFEDDAITRAQTLLLTFRNIKGDVFRDAVAAMLDMATILGGDLSGTAMQLGKALNDPVTGLNALRRAGVSFTEEQKATIKSMVELGDVAGAQQIILAELRAEFGGAAAADAKTTAGAIDQLKNAWGELSEIVGGSLGGWLKPTLEYWVERLRAIRDLMPKDDGAGAAVRGVRITESMSGNDAMNSIATRREELEQQREAEVQRRDTAQSQIDRFQWLSDITGRPNQPSQQVIVAEAAGKILEIDAMMSILRDQERQAKTMQGQDALAKGINEMKDSLIPQMKAAWLGAKSFGWDVQARVEAERGRQEEADNVLRRRVDYASSDLDNERRVSRHDNVRVSDFKNNEMNLAGTTSLNGFIDAMQKAINAGQDKEMKRIAEEQRESLRKIEESSAELPPLLQKLDPASRFT